MTQDQDVVVVERSPTMIGFVLGAYIVVALVVGLLVVALTAPWIGWLSVFCAICASSTVVLMAATWVNRREAP